MEAKRDAIVLINSSTFSGCLHSKDGVQFFHPNLLNSTRSEERRVGKECQ